MNEKAFTQIVVHIPLIYATSCQTKPIEIIGCVCNKIAGISPV